MAGNLTSADEIAIRGGNENLVRGVEVFGAERLFDDGYAGFGRDFHQDAAGDAFEAAGAERGREDLAVLDRENVRGSTFGNFAAFVEHDDFVETFFVRFRDSPDIIEPRDAFYARERRSRMAAVVAEREADDFTVLRERRGVNNQVDLRVFLVALPEAHGIVNEIDARAAFRDFVGANYLMKMRTRTLAAV